MQLWIAQRHQVHPKKIKRKEGGFGTAFKINREDFESSLQMSAYSIPIRRGHITGGTDLNVSGRRARFLHPVDEAVANVFRVPIEDIYDHCRGKDVDDARTAFIVLRKEYSGAGDTRLGQQIGRDHGSIRHARQRSRDLEQTDPGYRDKLNATRAALGL